MPTDEWKKGDRVTITVTGVVEQVSESGYLVNAHCVLIPVMKSDIIGTPGPAREKDATWTDEEMATLAEITPEDLANAGALWDQAAPQLKGLLDAQQEETR